MRGRSNMMSKQIQNKKAGLYYRLSQEDERAGESLSIENQKKILEKYARENGFEIIDEYIDEAVIIGLKTLRLKKC